MHRKFVPNFFKGRKTGGRRALKPALRIASPGFVLKNEETVL
jgi:hypothetical protein